MFITFVCSMSSIVMSRQSSGKTLLKNVIRHTDAHNKVNSFILGKKNTRLFAFILTDNVQIFFGGNNVKI